MRITKSVRVTILALGFLFKTNPTAGDERSVYSDERLVTAGYVMLAHEMLTRINTRPAGVSFGGADRAV